MVTNIYKWIICSVASVVKQKFCSGVIELDDKPPQPREQEAVVLLQLSVIS